MDIYTDGTRMKFFKTNKFAEDLIPVRVKDLEEAISDYSNLFILEVLVDQKSLCVTTADEIIILDNVAAEDAETLHIDFTKDLSYAEIADKYLSHYEMVSSKILILDDLCEWFPHTVVWEGDIETISLNPSDGEKLVVDINHALTTVETKIEKKG